MTNASTNLATLLLLRARAGRGYEKIEIAKYDFDKSTFKSHEGLPLFSDISMKLNEKRCSEASASDGSLTFKI